MDQCQEQKKRQAEVINEVVENANLGGFIDNSPMKDMVKNIIKGKQVDFEKIAMKVKQNIKTVLTKLGDKAVKKIYKLTVKVLNSTVSDKVKQLLSKSQKFMKSFRRNNSVLIKKIKKLISSFQIFVNSLKKRKSSTKKDKIVKKTYKNLLNVISEAVKRFQEQISQLSDIKEKLDKSDNKDKKAQQEMGKAAKKLELVIKGIQRLLEETNKGQSLIQKIFESLKN
jgi:DNA repair ATPase RecN